MTAVDPTRKDVAAPHATAATTAGGHGTGAVAPAAPVKRESRVGRGTHGVHARQIFTPDLLDKCIACGFCLPTCPTYQLTGVEQFSPRGRISLMRALQAGELNTDDPTLFAQSSACLGCRACEPVCPAGVQYGQLLEEWRDHQWRGRHRPVLARLLMLAVKWVWPLRVLGTVRRSAPVERVDVPARNGTGQRPAAPAAKAATSTTGAPAGHPSANGAAPGGAPGAPEAGPSLMLGCVERGLFPGVSKSARKLCPELRVPSGQGCCGALHSHNGEKEIGERMAAELGEQMAGTIVTTAGGCAAHLAAVLGPGRVMELSEYLMHKGAHVTGEIRVDGRRARVTLQDSCHLRNALGVVKQPRAVLASVADYVEMPEAGTCCGAAGSYSVLEPRRSRKIAADKVAAIERLGVDIVVTVNPGCQRQLETNLRRAKSKVRAVHIADLLVETGQAPLKSGR